MEFKYNEKEWVIGARTENFIVFCSRRKITSVLNNNILNLCEELLSYGFIPDFSLLANNNEIFFRK